MLKQIKNLALHVSFIVCVMAVGANANATDNQDMPSEDEFSFLCRNAGGTFTTGRQTDTYTCTYPNGDSITCIRGARACTICTNGSCTIRPRAFPGEINAPTGGNLDPNFENSSESSLPSGSNTINYQPEDMDIGLPKSPTYRHIGRTSLKDAYGLNVEFDVTLTIASFTFHSDSKLGEKNKTSNQVIDITLENGDKVELVFLSPTAKAAKNSRPLGNDGFYYYQIYFDENEFEPVISLLTNRKRSAIFVYRTYSDDASIYAAKKMAPFD